MQPDFVTTLAADWMSGKISARDALELGQIADLLELLETAVRASEGRMSLTQLRQFQTRTVAVRWRAH